MKNLRKVLAVVLVVCIAFSLMTVASAKQITDYSDASTVKYTEAVDLVTGLGIMAGGGGTTFDPTATFTREMAAKVICYILLGDTVSASLTTTTSSFKDVAATRWSAPFIEYCAAAGIINGTGDGNFAPAAPITGTSMAKLLLTALGYGAKGEFTGASWEINTLVKAQSLGILNTGVNYSAAATREQVAKYIFNVLTKADCTTVTYSPVTGTYILPTVPANNTLGKLTFNLLKVEPAPATYMGVLTHFWKAGFFPVNVVSGTYVDDNVLATSHSGLWLSWLTTATNKFYKASYDTAVTYYWNGGAVAQGVVETASMKAGVIVRLIDNDYDGLVDNVWALEKTVKTVSLAPAVDAAGTVTFGDVGGPFVKGTIVYPAGLAFGDVISYVTVAGVTYVEKATKVTGTMTAANDTYATITFAGTTYSKAGLTGATFLNTAVSGNYNVAATGWVDSNGYLVKLSTDIIANYNYGLLVGYSFTDDGLGTGSAIARLYTNDGKVAVYSVAANAFGVVPNQGMTGIGHLDTFNFGTTNAYLVSYVIGADGKVTLTKATNPAATLSSAYALKGTTVEVGSTTYYITSATKVIYFNGAAWSVMNPAAVLTGFNSAANAAVANGATVTIAQNVLFTNQLDAIYFVQAPVTTTAGNYAYLVSTAYNLRVVNGLSYYDYTGYVNGVAKTLTVYNTTTFTTPGLYGYTVNGFGDVATASNTTAPVFQVNGGAGGTVNFVDPSYIGYSVGATNSALVTDANTAFYKVASSGVTATAITPSIPSVSTTSLVYYKMNTAGTAAAEVYFKVTTP